MPLWLSIVLAVWLVPVVVVSFCAWWGTRGEDDSPMPWFIVAIFSFFWPLFSPWLIPEAGHAAHVWLDKKLQEWS